MATMGFQPYDMNGVHVVHVPGHVATTAATFVKGDVVYLASGHVTITASNGIHFGVAAGDDQPGDGTYGTLIPIYVADPSSVWIGTVNSASTHADVGEDYGLDYTTGSMSIDQADTTTCVVRVIGLHPADGAKALGRVLFCWRTKYLQGDLAA